MARNEEKQQGRLNRLWLEKERQDGRIKDVIQPRPKLATLNSVAAVKKWIPSIKKEIEYYLQQSQLSHYPERKIAEFQQKIEQLEKEYKRYLNKLRSLDPACKHKPWSPRAYTKRRSESAGSECIAKRLCVREPEAQTGQEESAAPSTQKEKYPQNPAAPRTMATSELPGQDLPLSFDRTKLAVVTAASRTTLSDRPEDSSSLAQVLHSGLPNLHCSVLRQAAAAQDKFGTKDICNSEITLNKREHVLGLGHYSSSSDEDTS